MPTTILDKLKRTITGQRVADAADLDGEVVFSVSQTTDGKLKVKAQNTAGATTELTFVPSHVRTELFSGEIDITATAPTVDIAVSTWVDYDEVEILIDIGTVGSAQAIYGPLNVFRLSKALLESLQAHAGDVEFPTYARQMGSATTSLTGLASHNGTLYGVSGSALNSVDPATGIATQIGSASQFGVSENRAAGLASHGGTLYMAADLGWISAASNYISKLYTLDTTTGVATPAGSNNGIISGTSGISLRGLASLGGTLYAVANQSNLNIGLYSISIGTNSTSTTATRIGSAAYFGVSDHDPQGLASGGGSLYMVGSHTGKLYTLDITTGLAAVVSSVVNFGLGSSVAVTPAALAVHNGAFYMAAAGNKFYRIPLTYSAAVIPLQVVTEFGRAIILSLARRADNTLALAGTLPAADAKALKIFGIRYRVVQEAIT